MTPKTLAPYRIEPTAEPCVLAKAVKEVADLRDYVIQGIGEEVPRSCRGSSAKWAKNAAHKAITIPPGLLQTLTPLPECLKRGEVAVLQITTLLHLSVICTDDSIGHLVRVEGGARHFCEIVLEQLMPIRSADYVRSSQEVWRRVVALTESETDFEQWYSVVAVYPEVPLWDNQHDRRRRLLKRAIMTLGRLTGLLNSRGCYELLESFLNHPWPEIRDVGGYALKYWRSTTLVSNLCSALLFGRDDPEAPKHSLNLFQRLVELHEPSALPTLYSLRGSVFDGLQTGVSLKRAIEACEQTIPS